MKTGLLEQLAAYGADHDEQQGIVEAADVFAAVQSRAVSRDAIRPVRTVALDRADGLRRAVDSVLAQRFDSFEHVVVDGGSADETPEDEDKDKTAKTES